VSEYESIRDTSDIISESTRKTWLVADQSDRILRLEYDRITNSEDLTDEAKLRLANEAREKWAESIQNKKKAAIEALKKDAKTQEQWSIPRPQGEGLTSNDPLKISLAQREGDRIVRQIDRQKNQPGPFKADTGELLASEYTRGLEEGGAAGAAICQGVLRASQELGLGDDWLNRVREQKHHEALDRARRLEHYSGMIGTEVPRLPREMEKQANRARVQTNMRRQPIFMPQKGNPEEAPLVAEEVSHSAGFRKAKRKPSWK
jgi:hypothetical protein